MRTSQVEEQAVNDYLSISCNLVSEFMLAKSQADFAVVGYLAMSRGSFGCHI